MWEGVNGVLGIRGFGDGTFKERIFLALRKDASEGRMEVGEGR